jgi:hypothetical protein
MNRTMAYPNVVHELINETVERYEEDSDEARPYRIPPIPT